jgi:hypothetical protein
MMLVPLAVNGRGQGRPEIGLVRTPQNGSVSERTEAVQAVVAKAPKPSPAEVQALTDALTRMNRESRRDHADVENYGDLIHAVAALVGEEKAIEPLIGALSTGNMASSAVAAFGMRALPGVLALLRDKNADSGQRAGAARAAQKMILDGRLDSDARQQVTAVTGTVLSRPEPFNVVVVVVELAWATDDIGLRRKVQEIAQNPDLAHLERSDARIRKMLQQRATRTMAGVR